MCVPGWKHKKTRCQEKQIKKTKTHITKKKEGSYKKRPFQNATFHLISTLLYYTYKCYAEKKVDLISNQGVTQYCSARSLITVFSLGLSTPIVPNGVLSILLFFSRYHPDNFESSINKNYFLLFSTQMASFEKYLKLFLMP